jgi:hypothetical protein
LIAPRSLEDRALGNAHADEHADDHEHRTRHEGNPPSPRGELIRGHDCRCDQEHQVRQHDADRKPERNKAPEVPSSSLRCVLDRHEHRAAPLTAKREPLHDSEEDQQRRRPDPDARVIREQPDPKRRHAHQHQRPDEHRSSTQAIAEVAHHDAAQRAREKADTEGRERRQPARELRDLRKELRREHRGGRCAVDEEVVPLDSRPDGACQRDTMGVGGRGSGVSDGAHGAG